MSTSGRDLRRSYKRCGRGREKKKPRMKRGFSGLGVERTRRSERMDQETFGSLKASISPAKALIGTQLQNTFLSP